MRTITRTLAAITLTATLASTPAFAADRSTRELRLRDRDTRIAVIVKRFVKRFFGITTTEDMVGPKPTTVPDTAP